MTTKKSNTKSSKKKSGAPRASTNANKRTKVTKATSGTSPAEERSTTRSAKPAKPSKPKYASGLDLAADVLAKAGTPLNAKTIAERVIAAGWKTNGLTPQATLFAAIHREIAKKDKASRFKKVDRGQFAINDARTTK